MFFRFFYFSTPLKEGQVSPDETGHIGLFHAVESGMGSVDETMTTGSELNATVLALQTLIQRSKKEFGVREIDLYYTCWWYSLCNFQYRQQSENTCSYNVDC